MTLKKNDKKPIDELKYITTQLGKRAIDEIAAETKILFRVGIFQELKERNFLRELEKFYFIWVLLLFQHSWVHYLDKVSKTKVVH